MSEIGTEITTEKKNGRAANPVIFSFPLGAAQQHSALRRGRNSPSESSMRFGFSQSAIELTTHLTGTTKRGIIRVGG